MKRFSIFLVVFILNGCAWERAAHNDATPVHSKAPVIDEPQRPKLEKLTATELGEYEKLSEPLRTKLETNNRSLQIYADQMLWSIREYNGFAKYNNSLRNDWLGKPGATTAEKVPPAEKEIEK